MLGNVLAKSPSKLERRDCYAICEVEILRKICMKMQIWFLFPIKSFLQPLTILFVFNSWRGGGMVRK